MKSWIPFGATLGMVLLVAGSAQAQAPSSLCMVAKGAGVSPGSDAAKPLWLEGGSSIEANCSAYCMGGSQIQVSSCSTCTAVDINCPHTPGYVTCNGSTTYCDPHPCPEGVSYCEYVNGGYCSPNGWHTPCTGSDLGSYSCNCFQNQWFCPV